MKLLDIIDGKALVPQLQSNERDDVLTELVDGLVTSGALPKAIRDDILNLLIERERKGSTGFGKGVAVPHAKHKKIKKMVATIGVSSRGVDFNALDRAPVYSVIMLLSPEDKPDEHLQAMENVFRNLQKDTFRRFLRQSTTAKEITDLIKEADAQKLQG